MKIHLKACTRILPGRCIASEELEQQRGLPPGWAIKNTGVAHRYWADAADNISSISAAALRAALLEAGLSSKNLDLLLYAGGSYDHPIPYNACLIKQALGEEQADFPCFDIDGTCLSFLHALDVAHLYLQHRGMQRVAIVCTELSSRALNPADPKTYTLFGDAAVALILEASVEQGYEPSPAYFINQAEGAQLALVPTGGSKRRGLEPDTDPASFFFQMNGRQLLALTLRHLDDFLNELQKRTGRALPDYTYIVPHQASKIGNVFFMQQYGLQEQQVINTLSRYGNCVAASIPLGLYELHQSGRLRAGQEVLLIGTAAGVSMGGMSLRW
jgi:3-oxoacyl-[acyl-carrier-protein] synthase-3